MAFLLCVDLDDAGWHPAAALEPAARGRSRLAASYWSEIVGEAERGGVDLVTIADRHRLAANDGGEPSPARLDALMIAMRVAPDTRRVGLMPLVSTTITEPFLTSSQIATLDHVSGGRAGWLADVSLDPRDGGYVGPRPVPAPDDRIDEAREYVEVVRRLWDSWQDDAEIRDAATHRFIDRRRIHHIDYEGRRLAVKGPSITPRSPQGQPPVAVQAADGCADAFAAEHADLAFIAAEGQAALDARLARLQRLVAEAGRAPGEMLRIAELAVFLDGDAVTARHRRTRLDERAGWAPGWPGMAYAGTAGGLAQWLIELRELGCDGVRLHPATIPHDLYAITRELTAELYARGTRPDRSAPATMLRSRLGLSRPASRYAAGAS